MGYVGGATGYTADEMRDPSGEYQQRYAPRSPPPAPGRPRWVDAPAPGGVLVDPHERDVEPGTFDPPPAPSPNDSLLAKSAWARENARMSPHVCEDVHCELCKAVIGMFYGRVENRPTSPRCTPCRGV